MIQATQRIGRAPLAQIDPDEDYLEWHMNGSSVDLGWTTGLARAEENEKRKNRHDKYQDKAKKRPHTNGENDGLGVIYEVGVAEALGFNPRDPEVLTLFKKWPYGEDTPDIKGVYECRRLNRWDGEIPFWPKDVTSNAIIIGGIVDHHCERGKVKPYNTVTMLGWAYPALDQEFAGHVCPDGGRRILRRRMRPMHTLPLFLGARMLAQPVREGVAA